LNSDFTKYSLFVNNGLCKKLHFIEVGQF